MSTNPLFPVDESAEPTPNDKAAVELIRRKVARAFGEEPAATEELTKATKDKTPSKHQLFITELSQAGKSLAEIQTEWHRYYTGLPDDEKREVWEEFYAANQNTPYQKLFQKQQPVYSRMQPGVSGAQPVQPTNEATGITVSDHTPADTKESSVFQRTFRKDSTQTDSSPSELRSRIRNTVSANGKLSAKHHIQSLLFGLGMGFIVLVVMLFGFFNEFVIAPFIQPSRTVSATPVIVSDIDTATATPTIIVPKINIQIPIEFGLTSNSEDVIQKSLEEGVVHYPNTALPGENGNGAYFGHSSQNLFNNGKYKFAFVLLHELTTGDVFSIVHEGKVYSYQVFAKEIVPPTQVSVLNDTKGKQATAALITCDPPGFNTNRLVVWGEQISPSPTTNTEQQTKEVAAPEQISSNGPTLWTRIWRSISFWD